MNLAKSNACENLISGEDEQPVDMSDWTEPSFDGPVAVLGFDCAAAYVDGSALLEAADDVPLPATSIEGNPVGYWVRGVGLLPISVVDDPEFSIEDWQSAGQELTNELLAEANG